VFTLDITRTCMDVEIYFIKTLVLYGRYMGSNIQYFYAHATQFVELHKPEIALCSHHLINTCSFLMKALFFL